MEENFNIEDFMLTPEDMTAITSMNTGYNTILDLHAPEEVQRLYDIECPAWQIGLKIFYTPVIQTIMGSFHLSRIILPAKKA